MKVENINIIVNSNNKIEMSTNTVGASIYYTLDGSEPTSSSNLYSKAIDYPNKKLIKVIGILEGNDNSDITEYQCYKLLTQDKINEPNKIYKIINDYDLGDKTINIPEGCTLKFDGGSFNNGTIITNNTTKLINYNGNAILNGNHINSGLFSNKPINTIIGKTYFCTDKQSPESTQPGLMIYHKGNNVWIDSMNRIVDDNYPQQTKIFVSKEEVSNAINNDLFRSSHNIVTSLSNVPTDKFLVIAEIQTAVNQSFSLSGNTLEAGKEIHVIIHNNTDSKITVTIPDNLPYINCNGESILSILKNSYGEINIISTGDKLYVRTI